MSALAKFVAAVLLAGSTLAVAVAPASAEGTLSFYGGANFSPHSSLQYDFNDGRSGDVTPGWDGESFEAPPYYGIRGTWWLEDVAVPQLVAPGVAQIGFAIDFTHAKVSADPIPAPFTTLEFTDGINFLTANAFVRHTFESGFEPYLGLGVGLSIPHVEVSAPGLPDTREYQVTGAAAAFMAGISYRFTERVSVFSEYKFNYGQVEADLVGGGWLDTNIVSNQAIVGVTFKLF